MLRITPMPSIFGLVKESYQMTTTAKVAIGLTLAEKLLGYMSERQRRKNELLLFKEAKEI